LGNFSRNISERFKHTQIKEGYCVICGKFGKLSQDHVPPKGSITITKIEQRHITESIGVKSKRVKGIKSVNGSKFKTICHKCNNEHLGANDSEIAKTNKLITSELNYLKYQPFKTDSILTIPVNALAYSRAMIGHILAATSVTECYDPIHSSLYFDPLREFVLGNDNALNESHDIYYWFYPFSMHLSAKCVGFYNEGHIAIISILSFFPLAFMVTKKGEGVFPTHSSKLDLADTTLRINISLAGIDFAEFPFVELKDNRFTMLNDFQAICSYPIKE